MTKQFLSILFIYATLCASAQTYTVGTSTITYTDPARSNRSVGIDFRYPGANNALASGQFPFVIFAHGFSMNQAPYYPYADSLAKRGYIVGLLTTETGLSPSHANFAQDLLFAYSKLISEGNTNNASIFYNHVVAKGAIGGHSMGGGSTVLAAQYGNPQVCSFTFAAATTNPSSITAAPSMTKPYLSFAGSRDCIAPIATHQQPMYDASGAPCKFLINIADGLHCQFGNANTACSFGEGASFCASSPLSRQQQIDKTIFFLVPYLDYYLKGDCNAWTLFESRYTANTVDAKQRNCTNTVPSNAAITGNNFFCPTQSTTLTATPTGFQYVWNDNSTGGTLNVNSAGTYSVAVGNGTCTLPTVALAVSQSANPAAAPTTSAATVCSGSSATLSANATAGSGTITTYAWSSGIVGNLSGGSVTPSGQTTYIVTVTNSDNCSATASVSVATAQPLTTPSAITANDTVCSSISNILISVPNDTNASQYNWTLPSGWSITGNNNINAIQAISGSSGGVISVTAENVCGPTSAVTKTITVVPSNLGTPGSITGNTDLCAGTSASYYIAPVAGASSYTWSTPNGWTVVSLNPDTAITYTTGDSSSTISVSAVNGCGQSIPATIQVTTRHIPSLGVIDGTDSICLNNTGTLNFTLSAADNADSIVWSASNSWTITAGQGTSVLGVNSSNTNGSVSVYASNQCGATTPLTYNVVYIDTPQITITQQGDSLSASAIGAANYQWYQSGALISGANSASYTPITTDNYTVSITNQYGCSTLSSPFSFIISGINDFANENSLSIFPNPNSTGSLQINISKEWLGGQMRIFDAEGRQVANSELNGLTGKVDLSSINKGVYLLQLENNGNTLRKKLVKQ